MKTLSAKADANPQQLATVPDVDKGTTIGKLAETMDNMAYAALLDLFNWANLWDDLFNAKATELTEQRQRAMLAAFTGFGGHPTVWSSYSTALTPLIMSQMMMWVEDDAYRSANKFSWLVLQYAAPALASQTKGFESSQTALKILREATDR